MKPFDDPLPEEQETPYRDVIELIQQVHHGSLPNSSAEQHQSIARVQQRLARLGYTTNLEENTEQRLKETNQPFEENPQKTVGMFTPLSPKLTSVPEATPRRLQRRGHTFHTLVAILIVGLLVGGSLVFLRGSLLGSAPAREPGGTAATVHAEAEGLEMSLRVTPGPYFLGELLAVDMSLTNTTQTPFHLLGQFTSVDIGLSMTESLCRGSIFHASLSGGHSPSFTIPAEQLLEQLKAAVSCPKTGLSDLSPGESLTIRQYVPLESSGQVMLKAEASFAPANSSNAYPPPVHSLVFHLNVASQVPTDRTISAQWHGAELRVTIPHVVHPHLASIYAESPLVSSDCTAFWWQSASTDLQRISHCKGKQGAYAVGAAGYAIVVGNLPL